MRSPRIRKVSFISFSAAVLIGGLLLVSRTVEEEPVTTQEILEKEEWSREELVDSLSRLTVQRKERGIPREVFRHMRRQVEKYPEPERKQILASVVERSVRLARDQWRAMPPEVRDKVLHRMVAEARKNRQTVMEMSEQQKEKVRERLKTGPGKAWVEHMRSRAVRELSPEERRSFAPVLREWIRTVEEL
jgi:flagellar biosynthesis GTPase FlhF